METIRSYLQQEYIRRSAKNPAYSLRAYAKHLGIYHATLSAFLSGSRKITEKSASKFLPQLGINPEELDSLLQKKNNSKEQLFHNLQQDVFQSMTEWYFDAILELARINKFVFKPSFIARKLGISVVDATVAIERLQRLGLLSIDSKGQACLQHVNTSTILDPSFSSAAMRQHQKKLLEKSIQSIDTVSLHDRDHSSNAMAIRKADLPKAKALIKKFRRELNDLMQRKGVEPDEVYQLQVSLFPLSKLSQERYD